jgi:hypothetical protein
MPACTLLCATLAGSAPLRAAGIEWTTRGAFEACLDTRAKTWIEARAALDASDDPRAGDIDDLAVAARTAQTLAACQAQAGRGDGASEQLFARYMAHWRKHIDASAAEARRRSPPD